MTATAITEQKHLSRGMNYLGQLGAKLRDLAGFATLACELIQNADDAPGATRVRFDVRSDALIVDNDGVFSDCGAADHDECSWLGNESGKMCDFHRFRDVASGDKRTEEGTTGAFGIGFTSVYQITDAPELISRGQHWLVFEDRPESHRIVVCNGCIKCQSNDLPGTRFILPWAFDANSFLRRKWLVSAITQKRIDSLVDELTGSFATVLLFLKRLNRVELFVNGIAHARYASLKDHDTRADEIIIEDQHGNESLWRILYGDFKDRANELRCIHGQKIEEKRKSTVMIAVPRTSIDHGVFYATLPTQESIRFPFHINADFFPSNDRKRIILGSDYQAEWNRTAISEAASILSQNVNRLKTFLAPVQFWRMINTLKSASLEADEGTIDRSFDEFWTQFSSEIEEKDIVFTCKEEWKKPTEAFLLERTEETALSSLLNESGVSIVHEDLRGFFSLLRECGVDLFDFPQALESARNLGFQKLRSIDSLSPTLRANLSHLCNELALLLARRRKKEEQELFLTQLKDIAIAPTRSGHLAPIKETFRADEVTVAIFSPLDPSLRFLDENELCFASLAAYCHEFDAPTAVSRLALLGRDRFQELSASGLLEEAKLVSWFESRQSQFIDDVGGKIAELPLFPCSLGVKPLTDLAIPGNFEDPIGITDIVDLKRLGGKRDFLLTLAPEQEMTFEHYVLGHIPQAFEEQQTPPEKKHLAIILLATHLGEISDNEEARATLSDVAMVACEDGSFNLADRVYIDNSETREVLEDDFPYALLSGTHEQAIREFYRWLGVATKPRFIDIVDRVKKLAAEPPNSQSVFAMGAIFGHLASRVQAGDSPTDLLTLKRIAWLPEESDDSKWYEPGEVYTSYRYFLFASQAKFLGFSPPLQKSATHLLKFLGVPNEPDVRLVVGHLLHCSAAGEPINEEVYRFLNEQFESNSVRQLKGKACLFLKQYNRYVRPDQVFWSVHSFGPYRFQLSAELRKYNDLFTVLNVKESPGFQDAIAVLQEISAEFGSHNTPLDEPSYAVVMECWRHLTIALENAIATIKDFDGLRHAKIVPDPRKILTLPEHIFFEERVGLATKFGDFLMNNVIPRSQGSWPAMSAVGVRSLEDIIESHLVECDDPVVAPDVVDIVKRRRLELQRVVDSQSLSGESKSNLMVLDDIEIYSAKSLQVVHTLHIPRKTRQSQAERVEAILRPNEGKLFFIRNGECIPWAPLAKEIARAISPDGEPGALSSGIYHVLASVSDDQASSILDQLGYPPLVVIDTRASNVAPIEDIGEKTREGLDDPDERKKESEDPDNGKEKDSANTTNASLHPGTTDGASGDKSNGVSDRKNVSQRGRLLSYVIYDTDDDSSGKGDSDAAQKRDELANKGVDRVVEYERDHGRNPEVMPPFNKGYDVTSRDCSGNIVRLIEVKSISGDWGEQGVSVTKPQFEFSRDAAEISWLYVVERAYDDSNYMIYPINSPARQVTRFMYDRGWKAVANDPTEDEQLSSESE